MRKKRTGPGLATSPGDRWRVRLYAVLMALAALGMAWEGVAGWPELAAGREAGAGAGALNRVLALGIYATLLALVGRRWLRARRRLHRRDESAQQPSA